MTLDQLRPNIVVRGPLFPEPVLIVTVTPVGASVRIIGIPHPDRNTPSVAPMVSDPEIERIAVDAVRRHEEAEGRAVLSVEKDNRGFDLISRRPHPEDPQSFVDVRFIEVKGRAHAGEVALTANEYKTAQRLGHDYWLYVVFQCATPKPSINIQRDPSKLDWKEVVRALSPAARLAQGARPSRRGPAGSWAAARAEIMGDEKLVFISFVPKRLETGLRSAPALVAHVCAAISPTVLLNQDSGRQLLFTILRLLPHRKLRFSSTCIGGIN